MQRQQQYMKCLYPPFMVAVQDDEFLTKLSLQLGDRMSTDLTLSELILLFETLEEYKMSESVVTFPGETDNVDGTVFFHPNLAVVEERIEELMY